MWLSTEAVAASPGCPGHAASFIKHSPSAKLKHLWGESPAVGHARDGVAGVWDGAGYTSCESGLDPSQQ